MNLLKEITELSHEFGTEVYVKGGGGNTSCKNEQHLWVKPSGTNLSEIEENSFVTLRRDKIERLFSATIPKQAEEREATVKSIMNDAVDMGSLGRPSLEAPLHHSLSATYIVHTHPPLVNGMTCGKEGEMKCSELFPEALWVNYHNPGFSLCIELKKKVDKYTKKHTKEPEIIFLKNHGVFISSNTPDGVQKNYDNVMTKLKKFYQMNDVNSEEPKEELFESSEELKVRNLYGDANISTVTNLPFDVCDGPPTPDHIVYGKSYPFIGELTEEKIDRYYEKYAYLPRVFASEQAVVAVGKTTNAATLALSLARDASLVYRLSDIFGGIDLITEEDQKFIENWEVETYRAKIAEKLSVKTI
jgi:rhamnose utilization protein RhaD (predicted bifunctional aldolase and dehydrogenase)